jgi:pyrrolidone-carboxylate peptidase
VAISEDAGLFVCNYIYFKSLQQSQRSTSKQKWHSVFIHVPPFETLGPEKQLEMAAAILDSIAAAAAPVQGVPVVLGQEIEHPAPRHGLASRKMLSCFSWCQSKP